MVGAYRINANLSVSRAFGDKLDKPFVSAEPDVTSKQRDIFGDQFIILACDGLWDVSKWAIFLKIYFKFLFVLILANALT